MNKLTFNGLSSGIDTETVVQAMLKPYQGKVDNEKKDKVLMEWKKEAWKDINNKILSFHQKFIAPSRLQGTFNRKNVTTSHSDMISINPGATLPEGSHTLKVRQLAESARLQTTKVNKTGATKVTTLKELGIDTSTQTEISFEIKDRDGKATTITLETTYTETDKDGQTETKSKNIGQIQSELQGQMANINVNFDEKANAFFVSSKKSGEANSFIIEAQGDNAVALQNLGLLQNNQTSGMAHGKDSIVEYNGVEVVGESNQVSINGLSVNLLKADATTEITIVSTQDKEVIVDFVKDFVEEYNKLLDEVNGLLKEKSSREYKPLTDEERKAMSEEEIKLWEKKAKQGLLGNDSALKKFQESMRGILGSVVDSNPQGVRMLADIGINTGDWRDGGKLKIDEDKLRVAIQQDSDAIINLFTKNTSKSQAKKDYEATNLGQRFEDLSAEMQSSLISKTGGLGMQMFNAMEIMFKGSNEKTKNFLFNDKVLDKKIKESDEETSKLQKQYDKMETYYYTRFTAMEKMMAQLNSQTSVLQQMGGA